jgi:hypothetical protein
MADEADLAQEQIEASLAHAIRLSTRKPKLQSTGFCHNCEAPIPRGWLWCDNDCRDDYDRLGPPRSGSIGPS